MWRTPPAQQTTNELDRQLCIVVLDIVWARSVNVKTYTVYTPSTIKVPAHALLVHSKKGNWPLVDSDERTSTRVILL